MSGSNANFDFTFESQFDIFRQFCQKFGEDWYDAYHCDELEMDLFSKEDIRAKHSPLWNDFVSIRINLLSGKLRQLFENTLNVNKKKLNQFYKYFSCNRMFCLKLPKNGKPKFNDFDRWVEMMEKFDGDGVTKTGRKELEMVDSGNLEHIYTFIVLWNGICNMMHKQGANFWDGLVPAIKEMKFNGCVISTTKELEKTSQNIKHYFFLFFVFYSLLVLLTVLCVLTQCLQ